MSLLFTSALWQGGAASPWLGGVGVLVLLAACLLLGATLRFRRHARKCNMRLAAVKAISAAIAGAQEHGPMVLAALEQLKALMGAQAAWFRLVEGDSLVISGQVGLSENFLRERSAMDARTADGARIVQQGLPTIVRVSNLEEANQRLIRQEGFDHIVLVPAKGKTAIIGSFALGQAHNRTYTPDDLDFLTSVGHQVGIAVENLRLLEQIIRSHRQWISTFDSITDLILVHDSAYRILKLNRAVLRRLQCTFTEAVFHRCAEVLPGAGEAWQECPYCEDGRPDLAEAPDPCFGGYSIVSTSSFTDAGSSRGTIHVVRDTTERREAEQRYRLLFERAQEGLFISTPEGRLIDCNIALVRMLGYDTREEVLALDIARDMYVSAEQRAAFCKIMRERGFVRNYEVDLRRRDGTVLHALENSFASRDGAGAIERFQGFLLDVTEKRHAENEIRRRNRELHALNAIAVITAQSFDLDEVLNTALRHVIDLLAADTGSVYLASQDNVLHRRAAFGHRQSAGAPVVTVPPEFLQQIRESHLDVLTHADVSTLPASLAEYVRSEGLQRWIWAVMWTNDAVVGVLGVGSRQQRNFSDTDQHLMIGIARQLATTIEKVRLYEETCRAYDDLRRTQEQLLQSEKMSALGQLISGVAHELNNPLTAILGYAQLLENETLSDRSRDFVAKLFKQAQRTQRLVQSLLSFARQRKPEKKQVNIRRVLDDTLALRDFDLNLKNITVDCEIEPELPAVVADAHQIEQVFLNIINNAVDAMLEKERGGRLSVKCYRRDAHVCIEFHDSGPGIREPNKVFDPFYTTKTVGKGTGLGLSICYGIVKEHGGEIAALNHPQGGALFRVSLPACASVPAEAPQDAPVYLPPLRGRILLVDDEEAVLEFEREALAGAGAEVVAVSSGEQAMRHLRGEHFDAVLVDSSMPGGWTGIDLYRWVAATLPGAEKNIILAVSNIRDGETRSFLQQARVPWIEKPFQVADLIAITRPLLSRVRAAEAH